MNTPTFEDKVTQRQAQWFTYVKYDAAKRELIIGMTHDPERAETQRVLHFADVQSVTDTWHDRDDDCMETLIGADEQAARSGWRYMLVTEQREIVLEAGKSARIYDV
jgi:hypothetical protein